MQTKIEKLPKSAIKVTVTVESAKVKEAYEKALDKAVLDTEITGFRKGNAPRDMVREKVGVSSLYGDVVDVLLQTYYPQVLKENHISPVSNPKVEIKEFDLDKDFEFSATVATRPEVTIGDYKKVLKDKYQQKRDRVHKENEEKLKKGEKLDEPHVHLGSNEVIEALVSVSQLEIADILIEEETDRLMSKLVNQLQSLGLSMDSYLRSQQKTAEDIKKEYTEVAINNIKAEFILSHLIISEKIEVTDKEVDDMILAVGNPESQKALSADPFQKLYIKSILQKNKFITKLIEEIEGENHHDH